MHTFGKKLLKQGILLQRITIHNILYNNIQYLWGNWLTDCMLMLPHYNSKQCYIIIWYTDIINMIHRNNKSYMFKVLVMTVVTFLNKSSSNSMFVQIQLYNIRNKPSVHSSHCMLNHLHLSKLQKVHQRSRTSERMEMALGPLFLSLKTVLALMIISPLGPENAFLIL